MIQRIQSVYLFLVTVLAVLTMCFPLAVLQSGGELFVFKTKGVLPMLGDAEMLYSTWGLMVVAIAIAVVSFITIFLFKKRVLQIRLCVFNALLMLGFYGLFAFFIWNLKGDMDFTFNVKFSLCFPFVALILNYLAIRNIGADEALVRSLERLR